MNPQDLEQAQSLALLLLSSLGATRRAYALTLAQEGQESPLTLALAHAYQLKSAAFRALVKTIHGGKL